MLWTIFKIFRKIWSSTFIDVKKTLSNNHVLVIFPGFTTPGIREALKRKRQAMPRQRKDTPLGRIFFRPWLWPKGGWWLAGFISHRMGPPFDSSLASKVVELYGFCMFLLDITIRSDPMVCPQDENGVHILSFDVLKNLHRASVLVLTRRRTLKP